METLGEYLEGLRKGAEYAQSMVDKCFGVKSTTAIDSDGVHFIITRYKVRRPTPNHPNYAQSVYRAHPVTLPDHLA
jgi:hypothetical protein